MRILNRNDIMETIGMLTDENLDVRTVTMGISLLDCIDPDAEKACEKIYNKITRLAGNLVSTVDSISSEYGIPIVNKRISVTPIAMLLGAAPDADPVQYAKALDRAAKAVGVNFIGGFGALVHKGFSAGDRRLIQAIPRALAETDIVCSSVNIGSTKSGINMDAVKLMGEVVRETAELNINIEDVSQSIVQEMFCMIMLVDLSKSTAEAAAVRDRFAELGKEMKMQVTVTRQEVFDAMHTI